MRVFCLDPQITSGQRSDLQAVDPDGHFISYLMAPMSREAICQVTIARGLDIAQAAGLLRKLADRMEQHGAELLTLEHDRFGHFDAQGTPVDDDPGAVDAAPAAKAETSAT